MLFFFSFAYLFSLRISFFFALSSFTCLFFMALSAVQSLNVKGLRFDGCLIAQEFAHATWPELTYVVKNCYQTKHNGVTHVYLRQTVNGLLVRSSCFSPLPHAVP